MAQFLHWERDITISQRPSLNCIHLNAIARFFVALFFVISAGCNARSTTTSPLISVTSAAIPSIVEEPRDQSTSQGCLPIAAVQLHLKLNSLHQVIVRWEVDGGCPPYNGTLTAWYQDEFEPYATYPISEANGQLLDKPILHRGTWDVDYTLEISDGDGHTGRAFQTIGVGH
jgi:hypothetical protein